jgi:DNA-binding transcriptional regulator YhcF (GntR family)
VTDLAGGIQSIPAGCELPWAQTARTVLGWIISGELAAGDLLPSAHALAAELGVHCGPVRRALGELVVAGILDRSRTHYYVRGSYTLDIPAGEVRQP